jgi:acetyltransferase-like isoleucine patch superfamily enzyme
MWLMSLCCRGMNLATAIYHSLFWSWRFKSFGWKSRLEKVDLLHGTKQIQIGENVLIRKGARIEAIGPPGNKPKIKIGDGTAIQFYFHCGARESVEIGQNVLMAGRVYISDHDHEFDHPNLPPRLCESLITKPVKIEDGVWLGEGVVVLKGVTIGNRAVIGANSVVTKDVPPFSIAAGVPAKVIRQINISATS